MIDVESFKPYLQSICCVTHHDPVSRRSLELIVDTDDGDGRLLDVPRVIDVSSFALFTDRGKPEGSMSYADGTLCAAAAAALAREFSSRLRNEPSLRRWLIAETFYSAFIKAQT